MPRRRRYVIGWVVLFALLFGVRMLFGAPVLGSVLHAAFTATLYVSILVFQGRAGLPERAADEERGARWRTYDGDRPRTWRGGWLHRSGSGVVAVPMTGDTGPRIQPADVVDLREREPTKRETRLIGDPMRVIELDLKDGRTDLIVRADDVPVVRRWAGRAAGVARRPARPPALARSAGVGRGRPRRGASGGGAPRQDHEKRVVRPTTNSEDRHA